MCVCIPPATVGITPLMDGLEATPVTSHSSPPQPPNLTILPLDTTTLSPDRSQVRGMCNVGSQCYLHVYTSLYMWD